MKPAEILEHFISRADWVDRTKTVDRLIIGDPEIDVDNCLVTWMPNSNALRYMVEHRFQLLICHEPTFWNHLDNRPADDRSIQDKVKFIMDNNLVILRNHDCWDRWPKIGIPWAWAEFLRLGNKPSKIGADGYQHRYDVDPISVDDLAGRMADRCMKIGEPMVQVTGDGSQKVSRIGIGTGCGCDINTYIEMGCDCSIVCDDGSCYWAGIQKAEDLKHPVIRVNHGTSEEPGMVTLTEYINDNLDGIHAEHLPHGSTFRLIGPNKNTYKMK